MKPKRAWRATVISATLGLLIAAPRSAAAGVLPFRAFATQKYTLELAIRRYWGCSRGGGSQRTHGGVYLEFGAGYARLVANVNNVTSSYSRYRGNRRSSQSSKLQKIYRGAVTQVGQKLQLTLHPERQKAAPLELTCQKSTHPVFHNGKTIQYQVIKCTPSQSWPPALRAAARGSLILGVGEGLKLSQQGQSSRASYSLR